MNAKGAARKNLNVSVAAVVLGFAGDMLLGRATGAGVGVGLWTSALMCMAALLDRGEEPGARGARPAWREPATLAIVFALFCAWRASAVLRSLDLIAVVVLIALAIATREKGFGVRRASLGRALAACARGVARLLTGAGALVFKDVRWREAMGGVRSERAVGVLRGALIALPLLIVFGALFAAADVMFARIMREALAVDGERLARRALLTLVFAWLAGGFLRGVLCGETARVADASGASDAAAAQEASTASRFRIGTAETSIALGSLDALFALFLVVQARYLFGGAEWVEAIAGLTYAEYARRGFFELVTAAALVLPLLLAWHALLRTGDVRAHRLFRVLAGALVALVALMMLSAVRRMWLYAAEYGLTELRLYTTAFMVWLGVMLLIFVLTILMRERRERFAWRALAAGLAIVAGLHLINPDQLIVRFNARRAGEVTTADRVFDVEYAASLSDDAVPALVAALPGLSRAERSGVARALLARDPGTDWRAWSWARSRARASLNEANGLLLSLAAPPQESTVALDLLPPGAPPRVDAYPGASVPGQSEIEVSTDDER